MTQFEYNRVMIELEKELEDNRILHESGRYQKGGIRNSQVRALVRLLVKRGILKPEEKNGIGDDLQ